MAELNTHNEPQLDLPSILRVAGHVAAAGAAATIGGVVVVSSTGCRCGSSSGDNFNYEAWAQTDGAAGRINMQAVRQAFEQATDPSDFELRVNRIYEGAHPVLIRVQNQGTNQIVEGWEDLNDDNQITQGTDDKMFTLTRPLNNQGQTQLRGHGANSYYSHAYPPGHSFGGGFFTGYLMGSLMSRPYVTPPGRVGSITSRVRSYRNSPAYRQQRSANRSFFATQRANNPRFSSARSNISPARQSFRGRVRSSGGSFRSSLSRSSGSFRGGGR